MDAINKFAGLQQTVISESQDTEIPPDQAPQEVSSQGIASVTDAFETFQSTPVDLSLNTPLTTPNPTPAESVDASSLFDFLREDERTRLKAKVEDQKQRVNTLKAEMERLAEAATSNGLWQWLTGDDGVIPKPQPASAESGPAKAEAIKKP